MKPFQAYQILIEMNRIRQHLRLIDLEINLQRLGLT